MFDILILLSFLVFVSEQCAYIMIFESILKGCVELILFLLNGRNFPVNHLVPFFDTSFILLMPIVQVYISKDGVRCFINFIYRMFQDFIKVSTHICILLYSNLIIHLFNRLFIFGPYELYEYESVFLIFSLHSFSLLYGKDGLYIPWILEAFCLLISEFPVCKDDRQLLYFSFLFINVGCMSSVASLLFSLIFYFIHLSVTGLALPQSYNKKVLHYFSCILVCVFMQTTSKLRIKIFFLS